jgi:hypothetical protein
MCWFQPTAADHSLEPIAESLREQYALLQCLKELRRQGRQEEAYQLARYLELLDQIEDWGMRFSA